MLYGYLQLDGPVHGAAGGVVPPRSAAALEAFLGALAPRKPPLAQFAGTGQQLIAALISGASFTGVRLPECEVTLCEECAKKVNPGSSDGEGCVIRIPRSIAIGQPGEVWVEIVLHRDLVPRDVQFVVEAGSAISADDAQALEAALASYRSADIRFEVVPDDSEGESADE